MNPIFFIQPFTNIVSFQTNNEILEVGLYTLLYFGIFTRWLSYQKNHLQIHNSKNDERYRIISFEITYAHI